jgi:methionyl-tRNA synthetase
MVDRPHVRSPYKILITSALPYVNNIPHMGNIIGCVLSADVFARYMRSQGNNVLFVCGTDEHGTATEAKALEEGLTPQQICDKYYTVHKEIYAWFGISTDIFGRTSEENHSRIVREIFSDLKRNEYILEKDVQQAYCEQDKKFLADRFVEGECPHCHYGNARGDQCDNCGKLLDPLELIHPVCKTCGSTPVARSSRHLFLDLPKLQPKLEAWVAAQSAHGHWTQNAVTTTQAWLQRGLEPRAITRDLSWGVPVPGMPGKVFYVWFDAPIGYVSITEQREDTDWTEWWQDPQGVRLYQFMAKDNIPFHTILFPATQLGTGKPWTMLHHINATEYLQHEDGKFSKSRGIGLFGDDAMRCGIPADVFRYYLLVNRPESADTVFSWRDLQEKLNKELLANLGNLVNRTLVFIQKYHESAVTEAVLDEKSTNFWEYVTEMEVQVTDLLEKVREKDALRAIMALSQRGNQYFQEAEPWRTRTDDPESCQRAMFVLANLIKDLAILLAPYLPATSDRIFAQLGVERKTWKDLGDLSLKGSRIGTPSPLFAKLEDKMLAAIKESLRTSGSGATATADTAAASPKPLALKPLLLRAGKFLKVERHPKADKLYIETVDFGGELRTIVSGLVGYYAPEDLVGRTAVFVTNLAPAALRGVESNGMVLAAQSEDAKTLEVLFVDAAPGTVLSVGAEPIGLSQLSIDEFSAHELVARDGKVLVDGKELLCDGEPVLLSRVKNGRVR